MRTNIELDDKLIAGAMLSPPAPQPSAPRSMPLSALPFSCTLKTGIRKFFGKVQWEGDLERSRLSRFQPGEE